MGRHHPRRVIDSAITIRFIVDFQRERGGASPRLGDIAAGLGASRTAVCHMLADLHREGRIRRSRVPWRIEVVSPAGRGGGVAVAGEIEEGGGH